VAEPLGAVIVRGKNIPFNIYALRGMRNVKPDVASRALSEAQR